MSKLPPALLERLKKRGIIKDESSEEPLSKKSSIETVKNINELFDAPGCPHKCNLTHNCNEYCVQKFGKGVEEPPAEIVQLYEKLVQKYPLPDQWIEVWEPGMSRFYFWNTENDQVCWYPPSHPKAKLSPSALKLKELKRKDGQLGNKNEQIIKNNELNEETNCEHLHLSDESDHSDGNDDEDNSDDSDYEDKEKESGDLRPRNNAKGGRNKKDKSSNDGSTSDSSQDSDSQMSDQESDDQQSSQSDHESGSSDRESINSIDEQLESVYD